jgi:hypothetical protein
VTPKGLDLWDHVALSPFMLVFRFSQLTWYILFVAAYEETTYQYLHEHPDAFSEHFSLSQSSSVPEGVGDSDEEELELPDGRGNDDDGDKSDAGGDTFKLTIRSALSSDITVTVRQTTTCGSIVKAFLQKAGMQDQYPAVFNADTAFVRRGKATVKDPRIVIDGDKMENDVEIGEADLEDGDLIEIAGL